MPAELLGGDVPWSCADGCRPAPRPHRHSRSLAHAMRIFRSRPDGVKAPWRHVPCLMAPVNSTGDLQPLPQPLRDPVSLALPSPGPAG